MLPVSIYTDTDAVSVCGLQPRWCTSKRESAADLSRLLVKRPHHQSVSFPAT